jgi:hypothetical protein
VSAGHHPPGNLRGQCRPRRGLNPAMPAGIRRAHSGTSALASAVVRRWRGSDPRSGCRHGIRPSVRTWRHRPKNVRISTPQCRQYARLPRAASPTQCARTVAEENGCGSARIHRGATGPSRWTCRASVVRLTPRDRGFWLLTPCWRGSGALLNPLGKQLFGCRRLPTAV